MRLLFIATDDEVICETFHQLRVGERQLDGASPGHLKVLNTVKFIEVWGVIIVGYWTASLW